MSHEPTARPALLKFDPKLNRLDDEGKELRDGISAAVFKGGALWVACDETTRLERLTRGRGEEYGNHRAFPLSEFLTLHAGDDVEADVEGMDVADDYLWLVGSHSLKRANLKHGKSADDNRKRLADVTADGNRFLLARIPLVADGEGHTLAKETGVGEGRRVAAQLRGDAGSSELTAALKSDKHLGPFFEIPGKDNGFDIEGLALSGGRVFVGLRGPVLRGWAMIIEVEVGEDKQDSSVLGLKGIGPDERPYRKHFLDLGGLGIRDLCADGVDLLILAGPTMDLDGPVTVFRWEGGARPEKQSVVFADQLQKIMDVPFGVGVDHAEGMALVPAADGGGRGIMLVYDAPSDERKRGEGSEAVLRADIFPLPG